MINKALVLLESEDTKLGTPEDEVKMMLMLWCQVDGDAPALVLQEGKNIKGAYEAIRDYAKKHKGTDGCAYVPPETAYAVVMEYYGAGCFTDNQMKLEDGLMYRLMKKAAEKWTPYKENPHPDSDIAEKPAESREPETASEKPNTLNLSAFSLEDEL